MKNCSWLGLSTVCATGATGATVCATGATAITQQHVLLFIHEGAKFTSHISV